MNHTTQQDDFKHSQYDTWSPAYTPSSPAPMLDGLPTCSEELVPLQSQEMDRPSSSIPLFKGKNSVYSGDATLPTKTRRIETDVNTKKEKDSRFYTRSVIRKRPHTEKLLKSLAKTFEEHMKEEYKSGFSESPKVKSWIENIKFTRNLIYNDEDEDTGLTERESLIKLEFKYKSYE
ncbi:hypothetical protein K449DRAFT_398077 [Hypoxylon sp. EC38]|nr:hypothetical protein K449DRAFT_398077 [Hypoxylon sp. EC38]